jgi:hypothetical protein
MTRPTSGLHPTRLCRQWLFRAVQGIFLQRSDSVQIVCIYTSSRKVVEGEKDIYNAMVFHSHMAEFMNATKRLG